MAELTRVQDNDQPLLMAEGLGKNYGRLIACRDVSFALYPGEVLAIVGESGSGKIDPAAIAVGAARAERRARVLPDARRRDARSRTRLAKPSGAFCSAPTGAMCIRTRRRACGWRYRPAPMSASG